MRLYLILAAGLSLLVAEETCADTIVLKNGRRIVADSVVVDGDRVRYLTAAGELVLPKSIVDQDRGGDVCGHHRSEEWAAHRCGQRGRGWRQSALLDGGGRARTAEIDCRSH